LNNFLDIKNIVKSYKGEAGSKLLVLDKVSFSTSKDDYITTILAPNGSGKTTLLKIISGLDYDYEGNILLSGNKIVNKFPFIPEKPSSFYWLNVEENIKTVFMMLEESDKTIRYKLQELIDLTGLTGYEKHFPDNKSYGFRFRISLARAIAVSSELILLDDPFKLMDGETKEELFQLIERISKEKEIRFLIASSNIPDAFRLSERILLITNNPLSEVIDISADKNIKGTEHIKNQIKSFLENVDVFNKTNFSI